MSFALFGCSDDYTLRYNKKYVNKYEIENYRADETYEFKTYYMFYNNGTGKYHTTEYVITFKYFIVKDKGTITMFYHSHKYNKGYSENNVYNPIKSDWDRMYLFTKDYLALTAVEFICEALLPNIPNYRS